MVENMEESKEETKDQDPKTAEFIRDLMKEKMNLDPSLFPNASRLIDEEIVKAQKGKNYRDLRAPVDLYRERPIKAVVKIQLPIKEHPKFNFVGKLLGPKGNSLKRLQEETMTKMAILGRGSMRDKQKEEELRSSLDPKYAHLADELHVEIAALAPPAEAYARLAYALAAVRKYLVPDHHDEIRMEQLREIEADGGVVRRPPPPPQRSILQKPSNPPYTRRPAPMYDYQPNGSPSMAPYPGPPQPQPPPPPPLSVSARGPANSKVMSILDKARMALEEYPPEHMIHDDHMPYEYDNGEQGRWKGGPYKTIRGGRFSSPRPSPYSRPIK